MMTACPAAENQQSTSTDHKLATPFFYNLVYFSRSSKRIGKMRPNLKAETEPKKQELLTKSQINKWIFPQIPHLCTASESEE
jgi:hypothetical protein